MTTIEHYTNILAIYEPVSDIKIYGTKKKTLEKQYKKLLDEQRAKFVENREKKIEKLKEEIEESKISIFGFKFDTLSTKTLRRMLANERCSIFEVSSRKNYCDKLFIAFIEQFNPVLISQSQYGYATTRIYQLN